MFTTLIGVTSELKQSEIATNLVPESEIRPNLHVFPMMHGKHHWYNPLSNKTYLLRTDGPLASQVVARGGCFRTLSDGETPQKISTTYRGRSGSISTEGIQGTTAYRYKYL